MSIFDVFSTFAAGIRGDIATTDVTVANHEDRLVLLEGGGVLIQYTTNGTWTLPTVDGSGNPYLPDDIFEFIAICGADGGGKAGTTSPFQALSRVGGKDGGAVSVKVPYSALPGTAAITIGSSGAGATSTSTDGGSGGVTSLGSIVTGAKGKGLSDQYRPGSGGQGTVFSSSPSSIIPGENGQPGAFADGGTYGPNATGGNGVAAPSGTSTGGGGGAGGGVTSTTVALAGGTGGFPGGGGGAGGVASGAPANGAAGAAGCVYEIRPH